MIKTSSVKNYAKEKGISYFWIAQYMEPATSETTLYRMLRPETLSEETAERILSAIDAVCHKRQNKGIQEAEEE